MEGYSPVTAAQYGVFVEYAYNMYDNGNGGLTPPPPPDFTEVTGCTIVAYLTCVDTFIDGTTQFYGYIAQSTTQPTELVVALRGTVDYTEWFDDLELWPVPFTSIPDGEAGWVEYGFFHIFESMQAQMQDEQPVTPYEMLASLLAQTNATSVTVVGHSLGGALATMLALVAVVTNPELSPLLTLYTLASPALGDSEFAGYFDRTVHQSYRVWNEADIVPRALTFLYTHVDGDGNEILQTPQQIADIVPSWGCEHGLLTYLWLLDPNNPFAQEFRTGSCWQTNPAAAEARRTLRARQLDQQAD